MKPLNCRVVPGIIPKAILNGTLDRRRDFWNSNRGIEANWTVYNIIAKLETYDRLLEVEDVVEVYDFSKTKVYRMAESKQIPAAMMGGTWKFDPSALAMWTASKDPYIAKAYRQLMKEKREAQEELLRQTKN